MDRPAFSQAAQSQATTRDEVATVVDELRTRLPVWELLGLAPRQNPAGVGASRILLARRVHRSAVG